jgi:hypothetical protein
MFTDESMKGGRKAVNAATARTAFFEISGDWVPVRVMSHHSLFKNFKIVGYHIECICQVFPLPL